MEELAMNGIAVLRMLQQEGVRIDLETRSGTIRRDTQIVGTDYLTVRVDGDELHFPVRLYLEGDDVGVSLSDVEWIRTTST